MTHFMPASQIVFECTELIDRFFSKKSLKIMRENSSIVNIYYQRPIRDTSETHGRPTSPIWTLFEPKKLDQRPSYRGPVFNEACQSLLGLG